MNFRIAALCAALTLVLTACSSSGTNGDGGTPEDGGQTLPTGGCSTACGPNQVCDEQTHTCVPGCNPACEVGEICVNNGGSFSCQRPATTCNGTVCQEGQSACVDGACSCLDFNRAARDTCAAVGKQCHQPFNSVTMTGGSCEDPKQYEFCQLDCTGPECGKCPAGTKCVEGFFSGIGTCHRTCSQTKPCGVDEFCSLPQGAQVGTCFPKSVFGSNEPNVEDPFGCKTRDMSGAIVGTYPSTNCLKVEDDGSMKETTPTGTCTYAFIKTDTRSVAISYCRSAGPVPEFGACKTDPMPTDLKNSCSTGLECVPTGTGNDGICLRVCNAHPNSDGTPGTPSCNEGESCVNIYRQDENNGVVGVCMKSCNVFAGPSPSFGCTPLGSKQTSCVPTSPAGVQLVSLNGGGFCAPLLGTPKTEGQPCEETDPMKGAACASGLICAHVSGQSQPVCVKPCDLECAGSNPPARCATETNATCGGGKTCTRVTGTTGATLGFCL